MAYANGRLPNSVLATIAGTTRRARADVVPQINAMRQAFATRFGKSLVVTDGYRDYDEQVRLKKKLGYLAGTPGTSNHGWGLALDLGSGVNTFGSAEHIWMKANAGRFGFYHPGWAQIGGRKPEAWHWETSGAVPVSNYINIPGVNVPNPGTSVPTPINPTPEEDIMVTRQENQEDIRSIVAEQIAPLLARDRFIYRLDVPGAQAVYCDVSTSARLWLKTTNDVRSLDAVIAPLPPDDDFWARTVIYGVGELYRKTGDATGAAYVLAGAVVNGRRQPTLRHVSAAEYAGMGKPLLVNVAPDAGLWRLPII